MEIQLSMFKLADALQMPLTFENYVAKGAVAVHIPIAPSVQLTAKMQAKKYFANQQVGVMAHVAGDLYIMVVHSPDHASMSAYLVDGARTHVQGTPVLPPDLFGSTNTARDVVTALGNAIVSAFYRKGGDWKPLQLPK